MPAWRVYHAKDGQFVSGETLSGFVPFGEYKPDLRYFANDGLVMAENVVPVYGDYLSSPALERLVSVDTNIAFGLYVDQRTGRGFAGVGSRLYECLDDGTKTDRSKATLYAAISPANGFWRGCSFGDTVVMTDYVDPVQYLPSGAALFDNMISSTFKPRARFCFPLRQNLFLANCTLPATYDGLASGANPTLVAWSGSDIPTQFGSFRADPQIVGAGYQPLNFDIGAITWACAGADCGVIGHSDGIVRVDGPPYTFRVIVRNMGGLYPYGACAAGNDIYVWTSAGLGRLVGGEGPLDLLGAGKFVRALSDNTTGFAAHPAATVGLLDASEAAYYVSMAYDSINDILFVAYSENNFLYSQALLAYNIREDRLSWFQLRHASGADPSRVLFMGVGRQSAASSWSPGRDLRFLSGIGSISDEHFYSRMVLGNSFGSVGLQKGFIQLSTKETTRITKIRPVYDVTNSAAAEQVSVYIESTNKPYGTPDVSGPYTEVDSMGFISCPTTLFRDFHAPKFVIAPNANMHKLVEYQGFEYVAVTGGAYGA